MNGRLFTTLAGDHTRSLSDLDLLWTVTFCFVLPHNGAVKCIVLLIGGELGHGGVQQVILGTEWG
jgi:hypothetical protein